MSGPQDLIALVSRLQWGHGGMCPICTGGPNTGHLPGCSIPGALEGSKAHPIPEGAKDDFETHRVAPTPGDPFAQMADWRSFHMGVDWQIDGVAVDSDGSVLLTFHRYSIERMEHEVAWLKSERAIATWEQAKKDESS